MSGPAKPAAMSHAARRRRDAGGSVPSPRATAVGGRCAPMRPVVARVPPVHRSRSGGARLHEGIGGDGPDAGSGGDPEAMAILIEAGADVERRDEEGFTPIDYIDVRKNTAKTPAKPA